jgi:hypothetical protein
MTAPLKPLPDAAADGLARALASLDGQTTAGPGNRTCEALTQIAVASAPKAGAA